ncbi:MAG: carbohydrate ABC transporter permease [Anaerolineae bacterium]|nr:carbohydrate ABC transporter permease [Anaerolineae bacterium]
MKTRRRIVHILSYIFLSATSFIMIYPVLFMALGGVYDQQPVSGDDDSARPQHVQHRVVSAGVRRGHLGLVSVYPATLRLLHHHHAGRRPYRRLHLFQAAISGQEQSLSAIPLRHGDAGYFDAGADVFVDGVVPAGGRQQYFGAGRAWLYWAMAGAVCVWLGAAVRHLFAQAKLRYAPQRIPGRRQDGWRRLLHHYFRVYGPLLKPPIVALIIVTFLGIWNDYLWPSLTIAGHPDFYPIAYRIQSVILSDWSPVGTTDYPALMVRTFLATWPPAAVYFLLQRYFVQGLVASGLKG